MGPDPGNWVSVGMGNSWEDMGMVLIFPTNSYGNVPDWTFYQVKNTLKGIAGLSLSIAGLDIDFSIMGIGDRTIEFTNGTASGYSDASLSELMGETSLIAYGSQDNLYGR